MDNFIKLKKIVTCGYFFVYLVIDYLLIRDDIGH